MAQKYHHGAFLIYLKSPSDTSYNPIEGLTNVQITNECETIEVASPSSSVGREYIPGRKTWTATATHLFRLDDDDKLIGWVGQTIGFEYYCRDLNGNLKWTTSGTCIVTRYDIQSQVGSIVKGSFQFQGSGNLVVS